MGELAWIAALLGGFVGVMLGLALLARRARRRNIPGGVNLFAVYEELYAPATHQAQIEIRAQEERRTSRPSREDP